MDLNGYYGWWLQPWIFGPLRRVHDLSLSFGWFRWIANSVIFHKTFMHSSYSLRAFKFGTYTIRNVFILSTLLPLGPHIYVTWASMGSGNGLLLVRHQIITWTSADLLPVGPLWTDFSEILIRIQHFSFRKVYLTISTAKWRPFCPGRDEFDKSNELFFHWILKMRKKMRLQEVYWKFGCYVVKSSSFSYDLHSFAQESWLLIPCCIRQINDNNEGHSVAQSFQFILCWEDSDFVTWQNCLRSVI